MFNISLYQHLHKCLGEKRVGGAEVEVSTSPVERDDFIRAVLQKCSEVFGVQ